jgi:hypothetical protein
MQHLDQSCFDFKVDALSALDLLTLRARTVAARLSNHMLADKPTAVDGLWRFAEGHGLVAELGADAVQQILAEAFRECGKCGL